jgi:hypothetical protein
MTCPFLHMSLVHYTQLPENDLSWPDTDPAVS